MNKLKKVCIVCPKGCELVIEEIEPSNKKIKVTGNQCKSGERFAIEELYDPRRTVQTTIKTVFKDYNRISVKTVDAIPKGKIFDVMAVAKKTVVHDILKVGDVVVKDIAGTGVDLVSTTDMTLYSIEVDKNMKYKKDILGGIDE